MPPLAVVEIPVLRPSPARSTPPPPRHDKGKAAAIKRLPGRREEESSKPLSIRLDQDAPRAATIIAREITDRGALYTLRIGEVEVPQVELDEILDYVSPEHLEAYESRQFVEEDEAQRVAEEAEMHARLAKLERMRERARTKGVLVRGGGGLDDVEASVDGEVSNVERGKHGRARPSYKAQCRVLKVRRRRKRHPVTGELMPLSDEGEYGDLAAWESSEDDGRPSGSVRLTATGMPEPPRRRRRKRDPATGELMPLAPLGSAEGSQGGASETLLLLPGEKEKRRRRKRHPLTGELMPLGWRFDPENPDDRSTTGAAFGAMSPAMQRMSLSQEPGVKRVKLAQEESEEHAASVVESDADDTDEVAPAATPASALRALPSPSRGRLGLPRALQQAAASSTGETSPEPPVERKKSTVTSIMQPVAAVTSAEPSEQEEEEEWIVEDILHHRLSDPRTHPPDLGTEPVLLYRVKWEGDPQPTWEPAESFSDPSILEAYHRMREQSSRADPAGGSHGPARVDPSAAPVYSLTPGTGGSRTQPLDLTGEEEEEEGYEIEAILAHELSDPRTHGPDLGGEAVMLYRVKWKGYQNPTWEPVGSFDDRDVVNEYRVGVGLPVLDEDG